MVKVVVVLRNEIREDFDVEVETKVEVKKGLVQADDAMDALSLSQPNTSAVLVLRGPRYIELSPNKSKQFTGGRFYTLFGSTRSFNFSFFL